MPPKLSFLYNAHNSTLPEYAKRHTGGNRTVPQMRLECKSAAASRPGCTASAKSCRLLSLYYQAAASLATAV